MKKYKVMIPVGATAILEVEANNKEDAIEKASDEWTPTLCHQCSDEVELGEFYSEDKAEVYEVE